MSSKNNISKNISYKDFSFYNDRRFTSEKEILDNLTQKWGFKENVGVIDNYHDSPSLELGILTPEIPNQMPRFEPGTKINIDLSKLFGGQNPIALRNELHYNGLIHILKPLINNYEGVIHFLIEYYQGNKEWKEMMQNGFKDLLSKK